MVEEAVYYYLLTDFKLRIQYHFAIMVIQRYIIRLVYCCNLNCFTCSSLAD